jgi:hypothetical protein
MNLRFDDYKNAVKEYCDVNRLNFNKILSLPKSGNGKFIMVAHSDGHTDGSKGLLDDTPMPCVLIINKNQDGTVAVEQTQYTKRYLAI